MPYLIRLARPGDAAALLDIYRPIVRDTVISFETEVPSVESVAGRIDQCLGAYPWLVYELDDGGIAGYAYASGHRSRSAYQWCVEVSAYVSGEYRRRGVAGALYRQLFRCLRNQGFFNAYAGVALPNPASVAFHEDLGFERVAVYPAVGHKFGRWHDVGWWALRLQDTPPSPPRPLGTCRDEIEAVLRDATG